MWYIQYRQNAHIQKRTIKPRPISRMRPTVRNSTSATLVKESLKTVVCRTNTQDCTTIDLNRFAIGHGGPVALNVVERTGTAIILDTRYLMETTAKRTGSAETVRRFRASVPKVNASVAHVKTALRIGRVEIAMISPLQNPLRVRMVIENVTNVEKINITSASMRNGSRGTVKKANVLIQKLTNAFGTTHISWISRTNSLYLFRDILQEWKIDCYILRHVRRNNIPIQYEASNL